MICLFNLRSGCLDIVVTLALNVVGSIVHINGSHALFPKEALGDAFQGSPHGSHLETQVTINGHDYIAVGYKYNSKTALIPCASGGLMMSCSADFIDTVLTLRAESTISKSNSPRLYKRSLRQDSLAGAVPNRGNDKA